MLDVTLPLVQHPHFLLVDVKSHNFKSFVQKRLDQGQSHIPHSDNTDNGFFILYLIFQIDRCLAHRLFPFFVPANSFPKAFAKRDRGLIF